MSNRILFIICFCLSSASVYGENITNFTDERLEKSLIQNSIESDCSSGNCIEATEILREELAVKYPSIDTDTERAENKKILCPFLRMLERTGMFDAEKKEQSALTVSIIKIAKAAREFSCSIVACGGVATIVSGGQLTQLSTHPGQVNLEALHKAVGIAHECGLTFAKNATIIDDDTRANTLAALHRRADGEGKLRFADLQEVKQKICDTQGVKISSAGNLEIALIYSFLGGNDRGFVDYSDVERFLHAQLPETIGKPGRVN
ncbi:MAG: hypothetical protein HRU19_12880 [Pseudobacteriovorax sp.]|nr:hypothetical protein [Pseudobacteriovorax sp.]